MALYELVLPKMGESIMEATIISWHKTIGDYISEDEIILEIATDKVDSEVPCPVSGIIKDILAPVDSVVAIGHIVAIIETDKVKWPTASSSESSAPKIQEEKSERPSVAVPSPTEDSPSTAPNVAPPSTDRIQAGFANENKKVQPIPFIVLASQFKSTAAYPSKMNGKWYSPLVRNIARTEGLSAEELSSVRGTGPLGRVTKSDIVNYLFSQESATIEPTTSTTLLPAESAELEPIRAVRSLQETKLSSHQPANKEMAVPMDRMRKLIAQHMVHSVKTSPHVSSVVEANVSKMVQWRNKNKAAFEEQYKDRITYSPLISEAVIKAIKDFPLINARLDEDQIILSNAIHLGIATAMDSGNLIVPVIRNADELNLMGLTKRMNDLTSRARINKLLPEEIQGGTFTISNIGTFNNLIGTPIINQPQLAILAIGAIVKRPIVEETEQGDIISIRHMMYLSLSFDHRVIDGFLGGSFLNRIVHYIESFDVNREI